MRRIPELDSIRGLAAIVILLYHLAPNRFHYAWAAVDCFFVLSSFLITSICLEARDEPGFFRKFYARRSLRIWPIYYLCLFALLFLNSALHLGESTAGLPYYLTYMQNIQLYWGAKPPDFIRAYSHTWTLALEEQYYMLWPLIVFLASRRMLIPISLAACVGSIVARMNGLAAFVLLGRCDGFALGGLLAVLLSGRELEPIVRAWWATVFGVVMVAASIAMAAIVARTPEMDPTIAPFSFLFFGLIGLVVLRSGDRWMSFLRLPALMYVGTISYGLYLYHIPIDRAVEVLFRKVGIHHRLDVGYPAWRTALEFGLAFVIASLSWFLIEKPILRLKKRFDYRRQGIEMGPVPALAGAEPAN